MSSRSRYTKSKKKGDDVRKPLVVLKDAQNELNCNLGISSGREGWRREGWRVEEKRRNSIYFGRRVQFSD